MANKLIIILLAFSLSVFGQEKKQDEGKKVVLSGCVRNSFTGMGEGGANVSVFREDGTVVASSCILLTFGGRDRNGNEFRVEVPKGRYRFHVECEGYKPLDYWYEVNKIARQTIIKMPDLMIQRDFSANKDKELKEVTVKATRVKMYYKGDTIVYNANAFKLPDGSMLDDLIRQLPGVEMKDNGEIFVNGRKLDFLQLNGKDFFGHNNKIMLENLPYYIVENLKVFEQKSIRSQALGHQVDANLYVMDVRVKKEYATGYIGNAETAVGTNDRYLARLFTLRFTDYSRLSFFGGSNNLNEARKPGADTEWKPSDNTSGTETSHNFGADLLIENKQESWKEAANALVKCTKTQNEERRASETFLSTGNTFSRSHGLSTAKNFDVTAFNNFMLKKPFFIDLKTDVRYHHFDRNGDDSSFTFNAHPDSINTDTLNVITNAWMARGNQWDIKQSAQFLRNLTSGDDLEINAEGSLKNISGEDFSKYSLNNNNRHRYNDDQTTNYEYSANALYRINFKPELKWELSYKYSQADETAQHQKYRLEQILGWDDEKASIDMLPSNLEILKQHPDNNNSNNVHTQSATHRLYTKIASWVSSHAQVNAKYYADIQRQRIHYSSPLPLDTVMRRTEWLHNFDIEYFYRHKYSNRFYYFLMQNSPSLMQQVPATNTYNPLSIIEGNPYLKIQTNHGVFHDFSICIGEKKKLRVDIDNHMGWRYYQNQVASEVSYNRQTGVYTYRPECVDGNYRLFFINSVGLRFNELKQLNISNNFNYDYAHNVDLYLPTGAERSMRSTVQTHTLSETLKASYDFRKIQIGLSGKIDYRYATSQQSGFKAIHATDMTYGANIHWRLPWNFMMATDVKLYMRRGYDDAQMNTDDVVWNMALSRSIMKGRLSFKLQGFDILQNLTNVTYSLNGQGRTETWHRTIPNYWMLHIQYKFNKNPKKK